MLQERKGKLSFVSAWQQFGSADLVSYAVAGSVRPNVSASQVGHATRLHLPLVLPARSPDLGAVVLNSGLDDGVNPSYQMGFELSYRWDRGFHLSTASLQDLAMRGCSDSGCAKGSLFGGR